MNGAQLRSRVRSGVICSALVVLITFPSGVLAANKLIVQDNAATPNDKFVVTDTGYVGSGTNTPIVAVHAKGASATASQFRAHSNLASPNAGASFVMMHNNGSTSALPLAGDRIGAMYFGTEAFIPNAQGVLTTNPGAYYGAGITIRADGNWVQSGTTYNVPAYMTLETASGTAKTERVKIASNGNVGIGVFGGAANPSQKLEVKGGVKINSTGTQPTCDATARGTFWVIQSTTTAPDSLQVCAKDTGTGATAIYAWKTIF